MTRTTVVGFTGGFLGAAVADHFFGFMGVLTSVVLILVVATFKHFADTGQL